MSIKSIISGVIVGAAMMIPSLIVADKANAMSKCMEAEFAEKRLLGMRPLGYGVDKMGNVFSILESKDGKEWTIIYTRPDGRVCFLTDGTDWETLDPKWGQRV